MCDNATRKRAVSRDVPVPITLFLGKPDSFCVKVVKISTGFAETTKIPLKPESTIGFIIDSKILTLVFTPLLVLNLIIVEIMVQSIAILQKLKIISISSQCFRMDTVYFQPLLIRVHIWFLVA